MRTYKKIIVPAVPECTKKVFDQILCDLCKKPGTAPSEWSTSYSSYEVNETELTVTVRQKEGYNFPEGGDGTEYVIDLCPDCFKNRLVPWFKSQGAEIKEKDWDW